MRPHENLEVWKRSIDLVVEIYECTRTFPNEEKFGLTSQIRRAAVSIPANIAEGAARNSDKEFAHFLSIAQGSASELETEFLLAQKLGYIAEEKYKMIYEELNRIARMMIGLSRKVKSRIKN